MVATIISRAFGKNGNVKLSLRIASSTIKNAIALNITTDAERWDLINRSLKYYMQAYRRGADFEVDGGLKSKLWNILKAVDGLNETGQLTLENAKAVVTAILRAEAIKEVEKIQSEAEKVKEELAHKPMMVCDWVEEFIRQCETGERLKQRSVKMIRYGTVKGWKTTLMHLRTYEKESHRVLGFDDMTIGFLEDWRKYFVKRQYAPNTIARHIKALKRFLRAAKDMKLTTCMDFESSRFTYSWEDVDNVYLTEERVQQLYELDITNEEVVNKLIDCFKGKEKRELKEAFERASSRQSVQKSKDLFVVGCLTGQRYSDYSRINSSMVCKLRDDNEYLKLMQIKTGKTVYIPLDPRVKVLLKKYKGVMPHSYDQKLNQHIKKVGHLLGWTETAGITERKGVMEYQSSKKFYECVKTHTARRTFATNAYKRGISLSSIMSVTGHSSEMMLRKYLKLDNKERAILAAAEFQLLKEA